MVNKNENAATSDTGTDDLAIFDEELEGLDIEVEAPVETRAAAVVLPKVVIAFLLQIRRQRLRITYGLVKNIGVKLGFVKAGTRMQSMGSRVKALVPIELQHFVCRQNLGDNESYWHDDAQVQFIEGWSDQIDHTKAPVKALAAFTKFEAAYEAAQE